MSSGGRKGDLSWLYFDKVKNDKRKGCRAKCKRCHKEMEGQVGRMKKHLETCGSFASDSDHDSVGKSPFYYYYYFY